MDERTFHCKILGVSSNASDVEIKYAYRESAKLFHPDKNPGNIVAKEKFLQLQQSYEYLMRSSPAREENYAGSSDLIAKLERSKTGGDLNLIVNEADRLACRAAASGDKECATHFREMREMVRSSYEEIVVAGIMKREGDQAVNEFNRLSRELSTILAFRDQMSDLLRLDASVSSESLTKSVEQFATIFEQEVDRDPGAFWDRLKGLSPELLESLISLFPRTASLFQKHLLNEILVAKNSSPELSIEVVIGALRGLPYHLQNFVFSANTPENLEAIDSLLRILKVKRAG